MKKITILLLCTLASSLHADWLLINTQFNKDALLANLENTELNIKADIILLEKGELQYAVDDLLDSLEADVEAERCAVHGMDTLPTGTAVKYCTTVDDATYAYYTICSATTNGKVQVATLYTPVESLQTPVDWQRLTNVYTQSINWINSFINHTNKK